MGVSSSDSGSADHGVSLQYVQSSVYPKMTNPAEELISCRKLVVSRGRQRLVKCHKQAGKWRENYEDAVT